MAFKVILTGVTGSIGGEVLRQCLNNPEITSIVALSRRPLQGAVQHAKLEVIVMKDFTQYTEDVIAKLSGADGCIWCMTKPAVEPQLELDFPRAFARAFSKTLAQHNKPFRYMHVTGAMVERDQSKRLWIKGEMRKLKGQGESQMIDFAKDPETVGLWETFIARPGGVVERGTLFATTAMLLGANSGWTIRSDELAVALIDTVMNGDKDQLLQALPLLKKGQELMKRKNVASHQQ